MVCEDKQLLYEEAPMAYKDINTVIADLEHFGLVPLHLSYPVYLVAMFLS